MNLELFTNQISKFSNAKKLTDEKTIPKLICCHAFYHGNN